MTRWLATLNVLSLMRTRDLSRARAAKEARTTPETVMRYAGVALRLDDLTKKCGTEAFVGIAMFCGETFCQ